MRERIVWIDYLKAICIYFMVICHAGLNGPLRDIIYQFHMPVFFIISGYLYHSRTIKKELVSFGIPVIFLGAINILYKFIVEGSDWNQFYSIVKLSFVSLLFATKYTLFHGVWFIVVLFLLRLLFSFNAIYRIRLFLLIIISVILSFVSFQSGFIPSRILPALPFFVLGTYVKSFSLENATCIYKRYIYFGLFFAFCIISYMQGHVDMYCLNFGLSYMLLLFNALIAFFLLKSVPFKRSKLMEVISTGTFLILGLHQIGYESFWKLFNCFGITNSYFSIIVGAMVLIVLYPIIWLLNKKCPLLLGK